MIAFIQFGADGRDESAPTPTECALRIVHAHQHLPTYTHIYATYTNVYTTCTHCRGRFIVPAYHGMYAAIIYVQPIFTPRTRNIYPRTPTFTPRTPTVMRDCIYTIRCGHSLFHLFCFSFVP